MRAPAVEGPRRLKTSPKAHMEYKVCFTKNSEKSYNDDPKKIFQKAGSTSCARPLDNPRRTSGAPICFATQKKQPKWPQIAPRKGAARILDVRGRGGIHTGVPIAAQRHTRQLSERKRHRPYLRAVHCRHTCAPTNGERSHWRDRWLGPYDHPTRPTTVRGKRGASSPCPAQPGRDNVRPTARTIGL